MCRVALVTVAAGGAPRYGFTLGPAARFSSLRDSSRPVHAPPRRSGPPGPRGVCSVCVRRDYIDFRLPRERRRLHTSNFYRPPVSVVTGTTLHYVPLLSEVFRRRRLWIRCLTPRSPPLLYVYTARFSAVCGRGRVCARPRPACGFTPYPRACTSRPRTRWRRCRT